MSESSPLRWSCRPWRWTGCSSWLQRSPTSPRAPRSAGSAGPCDWAQPIAAWHASRATNGPVEAIDNLAKRIKRVAFGLTNWTHWRIRVLLYAGKPDWSKLATITPTPT